MIPTMGTDDDILPGEESLAPASQIIRDETARGIVYARLKNPSYRG
jgi:hypothetical protein